MKYVRTKDGKILSNCKKSTPFTFKGIWKRNIEILFEITNIYKQADNLEKLFDEYVLENKDHTYQSLLVKSDGGDKLSFSDGSTKDVKNGWYSYCYEYLKNGCKIYGAIFVRGEHDEPILKPVAILNNKEEWELL